MLEKTTLEWFGNDVEPKRGSMILVNITDESCISNPDLLDEFPNFTSMAFPADMRHSDYSYICVWFGFHEVDLGFEYVNKWAYLPTFDKDC